MNFYKMLSEYYDEFFPFREITLNFLKTHISEITSPRILDIAAGTGTYSIELAKIGADVTAIDLSEDLLGVMSRKSASVGIFPKIINMDMSAVASAPEIGSGFDLAFCIGNSIVHLDSIDNISALARAVHEKLTSNGIFIVQVVNYDRIQKEGITELAEIKLSDKKLVFKRKYRKVDSRIEFNGIIETTTDSTVISSEKVILLSLLKKDLENILSDAGYGNIEFFGGFDSSGWKSDSFHTIVAARK